MAHYVNEGFKSYIATAAIPAGSAVKLSSATTIVVATSATDPIIGTIHQAVKAGFPIDVRLRSASGTSNIVVSATITTGQAITSDANGAGIVAGTAGQQIIGYAMEGGTAGQMVEYMPSTGKF